MTNNVYWTRGTPIVLKDSGGDYAITLDDLAAVTGRIGARVDLGAFPRGVVYDMSLECAWVANPVAGETADVFAAYWDNDTGPASPWAEVAATDSALTATQRQNMEYLFSTVAQSAAATLMRGGRKGIVIPYRYVSFAVYNTSAGKAFADVAAFPASLRLTPRYPQIQ